MQPPRQTARAAVADRSTPYLQLFSLSEVLGNPEMTGRMPMEWPLDNAKRQSGARP